MSNIAKMPMAPASTHVYCGISAPESTFGRFRLLYFVLILFISFVAFGFVCCLLFTSECINNSEYFLLFILPCVFVAMTFSLHQWNDKSYVLLSAHCCRSTKTIHSVSFSLGRCLGISCGGIFLRIISIFSSYEFASVLCIVCFVGLRLLIFHLSPFLAS